MRAGSFCLLLVACADAAPAGPPAKAPEVAPATGPVIGRAMAPAPQQPEPPPKPRGELMAPAVFPPARTSDVDLGTFLPGTLDAKSRERFAEAEQLFQRGDDAAADKLYAKLPKDDGLAPWVALARLRIRAKKEDWPTSVGTGDADARVASAITLLGKLDLSGVPEASRGPFHLERGRWLLVHGDYDRARTTLDQAVKTLPNEPEALSLLGLSRLASGHVAEALEPIERATELDLGSAARWGNLGTIRMMNAKINEASRAYEARVRLAPADAQGHADLGIALVQIGEYTRGRAELLRATELAPDRASYLSNYAYALHRSGKRGEARVAYERALGKDPKLLVALLGYSGLLSENPAELPEARRVFERAQKVAPADPRVLAAKADLEELEKKRH